MDFGITEKFEQIQQLLSGQSVSLVIIFSLAILLLWFLPAILATFLNRKHFKKILVACIPAGLSFIAWFALIGWAITGKLTEKNQPIENEKST